MTRPQHLLRLSKYLPAFDLTSLTQKKKKKGILGRCCISSVKISKAAKQTGCDANKVLSSCTQ